MNKLLTPAEVAELLAVRESTIYQWTHQGLFRMSNWAGQSGSESETLKNGYKDDLCGGESGEEWKCSPAR